MCIRDRCYTGENADGSISYNEELVGVAIQDFRDEVIVATKFGVEHKGDHLELDSSPAAIRKSLEGSLKRLNVDSIDLYYQHRIDPKVEPEVVAGVMKELITEGKIKAWGISEANEDYLRRAHAICPVTAVSYTHIDVYKRQVYCNEILHDVLLNILSLVRLMIHIDYIL